MTTLITLYLLFGLLSYWPALYYWQGYEHCDDVRWYHFIAAWAIWTICWPYRYIQDLVYWWRAKK